jgi:hypothetical protein
MRALLVTADYHRLALDFGVTLLATAILVALASSSFSRIIK